MRKGKFLIYECDMCGREFREKLNEDLFERSFGVSRCVSKSEIRGFFENEDRGRDLGSEYGYETGRELGLSRSQGTSRDCGPQEEKIPKGLCAVALPVVKFDDGKKRLETETMHLCAKCLNKVVEAISDARIDACTETSAPWDKIPKTDGCDAKKDEKEAEKASDETKKSDD